VVHSFLNQFATKSYKRFPPHLNMFLHYLVTLEMFIAHVLLPSCYRKKLQNLPHSHLNCGLQIRRIWIQLITMRGDYCKRRCTKYA